MYVRTRLLQDPSNLRIVCDETYSFPQRFFAFTESLFPLRKVMWAWRKNSPIQICLISLGPDSLCEVAKNSLKSIFYISVLNSLHAKLQTAMTVRSWNISWNLHSVKLSWLCCIHPSTCIYKYFPSHFWEEIGEGTYILAVHWKTTSLCSAWLQAKWSIRLYGWNLPDPLMLLLIFLFENQERWWPF